MTVLELMKELRKFPANMQVAVWDGNKLSEWSPLNKSGVAQIDDKRADLSQELRGQDVVAIGW